MIVATDLGAVKLAERYQTFLHLPVVVIHKARISGSEVSLRSIIGDVKDRAPIIVDDMIITGATIEAAVKGLLEAGCKPKVSVVATHALFVGTAVARLQALPIDQLIGTNSVETTAELPRSLSSRQSGSDDCGDDWAPAPRPIARESSRARMNRTVPLDGGGQRMQTL